ncbi:MAG: tryptophanyl-tRNA synthetase [Campylobacterota bacterium]|nr:tryptophanyl-tRNA synthetase [Campylobacterota bacterium]
MRVLSGIQPSGDMHIGNYFGMMKRLIELQKSDEVYAFIANYHAMTSLSDGKALSKNTLNAAINFLSLGIEPEKTVFWVQSDIPEVLELYWILSNFTPMGLLERAHSYKDKTAKGIQANHGLFSYPVLMAADILLFDTQVVPVGKDQIQHVEIARDIALKFNNHYGDILTIPEFRVEEEVATVIGIDGAKMSKSYGNTIDIFCTKKELEKKAKSIVTDSTPLEDPKDYSSCNVYALSKLFLNENELTNLQERYKSGKEGYGHFKLHLADIIWNYYEPYREKREYFLKNIDEVKDILKAGKEKAKKVASKNMEAIRNATGINY